jgi:hypothetical protein
MIINVLKVFDIVLALAPESTQQNANVIALAMWRTAFGGVNDFGTGSAIAVFLFLLVLPVLALAVALGTSFGEARAMLLGERSPMVAVRVVVGAVTVAAIAVVCLALLGAAGAVAILAVGVFALLRVPA